MSQQVEIQYLACNGCRNGSTMAAIFHQYGQGNSGVIRGGKGNEQGVIAIALSSTAFAIFFTLSYANHLGCSGFSSHIIAADGGIHPCTTR